ncbi:neutral zinc metallopeptidase [Actinokineospora sp. NBRC 105648]|uniref:neutral zinc metallopeptidase n=1 Tax=Actinokineospora sp. NBRC 105648 TaxID=3032206 RepID=UPI0024A1907F|nr:neutral zinc metallopeptidase [Actinokineospora sp. NBRC 105648]GLZ43394.1 aminopeptidase [Actinokineospora sp. NBRC 105648]
MRGIGARVRVAAALAAAVAVVVQLGGCAAQPIEGRPRGVGDIDAGTAAGIPVNNDGPNGPKTDASDATIPVENADNGEMDRLAVNALSDIYDYWSERMPADFDGQQFEPIKRLASYDSDGTAIKLCGQSTAQLVNAFYCGADDSVAWDRGVLLPMLNKQFGPMSVVAVLAHEMGHAVQFRLGAKSNISQSTPTIVKEQQADCYAGGFFRWVAEGKAKHFDVNTGKGLNHVLATMFFIRDPAGLSASKQGAHGLAFDRVFAFQAGFSEGPTRCSRMNQDEVNSRVVEKERKETEMQGSKNGDVRFADVKVQELLQKSLDDAFKRTGANPPKITYQGADCKQGKSTPPVSFCGEENVVAIDPDAMQKIATPPKRGQEPGVDGAGIGDFAAFAEIASRYSLSIQKSVGAPLDGDKTGLRTACLTGAWAKFTDTADSGGGRKLRLAVGDLDEAVAELLQDNSLVAADANGKQVPSGFARVEAFRIGYFEGDKGCANQFS